MTTTTDTSAWSLHHRLRAFLIAIGVVVVALIVVSITLLVQLRSQQARVINRYFNALNLSNQRFVAQVDAETGIRGYALTGDRVTLAPVKAFLSPGYAGQPGRLLSLIGDDPTTREALNSWDQAAQTWYRDWGSPTVDLVARRGSGGSLSTARVLEGKAFFDRNRQQFASYINHLNERREAARQSLELRTTLLFVAVLIAVAAIALSGISLWFGLRRWVLQPVNALGDETRLVRSGALDHAVTVSGPTEITSLATDVDDMRRDIVRQLAEVEQAREEIEAARASLQQQAEELARSNRDLEQFAYVASHDLQEPLRKVASFCQMLERRYKGQLDERADQYIAFAVDGAKRMQQLINDLLAFSRVGRMSEGFRDVGMQTCFDTAVGNLGATIEAANARVTSDPLPTLPIDRSLTVQLLQNLIGNGIKFRGEQRPTVHIGATERDDGFWEFSCADNGIGIEPQYSERIFVIFQRLHPKEEYTGTGIGLALCKRIVEYHGGQIWLDTEVAGGTTIHWSFPTEQTDPSTPASLEPQSAESAAGNG